ncbi:MAG: flagellar biosynthesis repressor FlbT [Alphaproteobacteria bacterium]|nr:flagellar biosynthesis repressor FlbT [Alphaproteobacteria bacterium]
MPLKLSLPRGEKLVVNGAVIKNDGPDVNLVFENQAHIMRQKDIMTMEEATSPGRRIYLALQCAYMFDDRRDEHLEDFEALIGEFREAAPSSEPIAEKIIKLAGDGDLYGALKECRKLIEYEGEILQHVQ